jgi:hypothetical protein
MVAAVDESRGRPSFKLSGLAALSDEAVGGLIPVIPDVSAVDARDGHYVVRRSGRTVALFPLGSREAELWSRFDGRSTLRAIAAELAAEWNEPAGTAFRRAREVFLRLVAAGICRPVNPLE